MQPQIYRVATAIIVILVVIVGGVLALTDHLTYAEYFRDVSIGAGLLGIGLGIDPHSKP